MTIRSSRFRAMTATALTAIFALSLTVPTAQAQPDRGEERGNRGDSAERQVPRQFQPRSETPRSETPRPQTQRPEAATPPARQESQRQEPQRQSGGNRDNDNRQTGNRPADENRGGWQGRPGTSQGATPSTRSGNTQSHRYDNRPDNRNDNRPDNRGSQSGERNWGSDSRPDNRNNRNTDRGGWDDNRNNNRGGWDRDRNDRNDRGGWDRDRNNRERNSWSSRHSYNWRSHSDFRSYTGIRIGFYFAPRYGYYRVPTEYYGYRYSYGDYLPRYFFSYRVYDPYFYDLPARPYGTEYYFVGRDIVLVDIRTGFILDVFYDVF